MSKDMNTIREIILQERKRSLSEREWKHRLKGYGYRVRSCDARSVMVSSLLGGGDIVTVNL